jgi:hypothetical protein
MFYHRDLMLNLAAARAAGGAPPGVFGPDINWGTYWCTWGCCYYCSNGYSCGLSCDLLGATGGGGGGCHPVSITQFVVAADPTAASRQLALLKAQLREALSQIDRQEEVLAQCSQPQAETLDQVAERESKLHAELAELAKRKAELGKK